MSMRLGLWMWVLILLAAGCERDAGNTSVDEVAMEWNNATLDVGRGVDSLSEVIRGKCVKFDDADFTAPLGGNQTQTLWNIELITDRRTFEKRLDISATAKLRAGIAAQGSVKGRFLQMQTANAYNVYVLVSLSRDAGKKVLREAEMAAAAANFVENGNLTEFRRRCGDEYFSAVRYGGEFFSVLEFRTSSDEFKQLIESQVSASARGGVYDASGSVSFRQAIQEISKHTEVRVSGYQLGGSLTSISDQMTVDGLLAAADKFAESVSLPDLQNASPIFAVSEPYTNLLSYPMGPNAIDLTRQREMITDMDERRLELRVGLDNIDFILANPSQFEDFDADELIKMRKALVTALNKVGNSASACFDDIQQCNSPQLEMPAILLPKRKGGALVACTNEHYNLGTGAVCGEPRWPLKRSEVCGVERYYEKRDEACGVDLYKKKRSKHCGPETFNVRADASCPGSVTEHVYTEVTSNNNGAPEPADCKAGYLQVGYDTETRWRTVGVPGDRGEVEITIKRERTCKRQEHLASCSKPEFGAATYKSCRHPKHGAEKYKACRKKAFGVELYSRCEHKSHGPATYPTCRDASFGFVGGACQR